MRLKSLTPGNVWHVSKMYLFYLFNFWKYKELGSRAFIINPLRLNGRRYMSIHRNVVIQKQSWLATFKIDDNDPELVVNEGCALGDFNHVVAVRRVIFGKNVLTANGVYVSDNLHSFEDIHVPIMHQPVKFKAEVHIGEGSWLGENVCVIGASIGKHCVIGANSVVTKDIPAFSVAVGTPAKVIKQYNHATNKWENVRNV